MQWPQSYIHNLTRIHHASLLMMAIVCASCLAGCDSFSFVPPPPPEINALNESRSVRPSALSVEMIFAPGDSQDRQAWELSARREAGRRQVIFSVIQPPASASPATQAGLIRSAAERGVAALVVEPAPGENQEVVDALNDVQAKGIRVVLLLRDLPSRDPAKPFSRLSYAPFSAAAVEMVEALKTDAKLNSLPEDGHALVVFSPMIGPAADDLAKALRQALKDGGVTEVADLSVNDDINASTDAVIARLKADPKLVFLVAPDAQGFSAALSAADALKAERAMCVGGSQSIDRMAGSPMLARTVGIIERNTQNFAIEAVRLAVKLARGETQQAVIEIPTPFQSVSIPTLRRANDKVEDGGNTPAKE